ncbi:unnamed protein product [Didymodactylos carnosus]|uniref:ATP-grasp domain-containing protein n=1 Tax=Didymodactylos carnosus TaxID=1234261 RepID=A0A813PEP0_9BILA|nr:unnamed protein product [Didymodactylos carnosus]CAF0750039.1 unnamed protein product [Didymodactylos carnosus]CAF3505351.1 unnamed protein product [Didymodactylos carnosus]CAF3529405.1 unnamed protein product [Didymodactylos carnosus]
MSSRAIIRLCDVTIRNSTNIAASSTTIYQSRRWISLHEYQSKKILNENNLNVQRFQVVDSPEDAFRAGQELMKTIAKELVIKAQILAGGRGKGTFDSGLKGGVKLTKDPKEAQQYVKQMVKHRLVTKQTPKEGVEVQKVMVAEALDIARETYLAILLDRAYGGAVLMGSPCGGVDIEEVAEKTPDQIYTTPIDPVRGMQKEQAHDMAVKLGFKGKLANEVVINFDAKLSFDDNAKFRQQNVFDMEDTSESDQREVEATQAGLNYIGLHGNIGCLVNGAGLAMGTMDIIKLHGGQPANFLDVGGGVKEEQVLDAFKILFNDPQVKAVLVNIFGGIVNCAIIANGIVKACQKLGLKIPLVVRLQGTNMDEARKILQNSSLPITAENDFEQAAIKVCSMAQGK